MGIFCQRKALNVGEIFQISQFMYTLPEMNRAPENGWWLPGRCYVSIRECTCCLLPDLELLVTITKNSIPMLLNEHEQCFFQRTLKHKETRTNIILY